MIKQLLIILQSNKALDEYFNQMPNIFSTVFIALLILIIILIIFFISYQKIYNPMLRKHKSEKQQLEKNTLKMLATFSELDPNPIVRVDSNGVVIGMNKSAKDKFYFLHINKSNIQILFDGADINLNSIIDEEKSFSVSKEILERYYEINIHGISFMHVAQLYFWDVTLKKQIDDQMNSYQKLLRNTSVQLQKVLDDERNRISHILHDSISQNLLLTKLNILKYKKYINTKEDEEEYKRTLEIIEQNINEVRSVAHNLKPINLEELGLLTSLKSMCIKVARESGLKYQLDLPDSFEIMNPEIELTIFRFVQESLNNILRHSRAKSFSINLEVNDSIIIVVSDDGIGFNPDRLFNEKYISDGMGIMSMQENIERLNGTFQIDSSHNQGTTLIAEIPITEKITNAKPNY